MLTSALIYFVLGFAIASLLAILLSRLLFDRAYKKAEKRLRGQIPLNKAELEAERDRLRSEYAINLNKLEHKVTLMQQSELALRIDYNNAQEHKLATLSSLDNYIKKSVRWQEAHDNAINAMGVLQGKIDIQNQYIKDIEIKEAERQIEQKKFDDARLNYQISEARYLKLKNEREENIWQIKNMGWQLEEVSSQFENQSIELSAIKQTNSVYEAQISEFSTKLLLLEQQIHAKNITADMSEKAIENYKQKLINAKLSMHDIPIGKRAIFAIKTRLSNIPKLHTAPKPSKPMNAILNSINTNHIVGKSPKSSETIARPDTSPLDVQDELTNQNTSTITTPKLVHNADKNTTNTTKLTSRMNALAGDKNN